MFSKLVNDIVSQLACVTKQTFGPKQRADLMAAIDFGLAEFVPMNKAVHRYADDNGETGVRLTTPAGQDYLKKLFNVPAV